MKKLLVIFCIALAIACTNKKADPASSIFIEEGLKTFIENNPDWTKNEQKEAEITKAFKHKMINLSNDTSFLKNMPLQFKRLVDTTEGGQPVKVAHFRAYNDTSRTKESLLNYIQLHIKGIVSDDDAAKLKTDNKYLLTGTLQRQGKRADVKFINVADFKGYDVGSYTFFITAVKPL